MPSGRRYYIAGERKFVCDNCGYRSYRLSEMQTGVSGSQIGFNICPVCFDPAHIGDEKVVLRPIVTDPRRSAPIQETLKVEVRVGFGYRHGYLFGLGD